MNVICICPSIHLHPSRTCYLVVLTWLAMLGWFAPLAAEENPAREPPEKSAELPWRDLNNRVIPYVSKHTDRSGHAHATVVFLLRDENGRGLAIGTAGSEMIRIYFLTRFEAKLREVRSALEIVPSQEKKLRLAAELDVVRLMRRVQEIDRQLSRIDYETGRPEAQQLVAPLHATCERGLFGPDSLFSQVLSSIR